ncbi:MAG TPA: S53 family peptidase, partial [Ktedonobacteraceae bacterium]|nr:S53 family peptidase [Ktedonobacteraceae bacterium]
MPIQFFPLRRKEDRSRSIFPVILVPLLAIALIVGTGSFYLANFAHAAPADTLVAFPGTIPAALAHSKIQGPAGTQQNISLSIGLQLRNANLLRQYVNDISSPKSANYHRYLSQAQISSAFSPDQGTYNAVEQYLQKAGFTITHTYTHRLLISFRGSVGLAEQVFHVSINTYSAPNGQTFFSNSDDPFLPASLAGAIQSISGLNNALSWQHTPLPIHKVAAKTSFQVSPSVTCLGNGSNYYTPGQLASAYNLNGLYSQGYHGEGQTLALFELDSAPMSDITTFASCYGHSTSPVRIVPVDGGPPPPASGDQGPVEVELDADIALSMAPGLGQLKIYEAPNTQQAYDDEWAQIIQDNPPVISTSWGSCESDVGQQEATTENNDFLLGAAQGESIFVASGDTGSTGCLRTSGSSALNAGDPAGQPYITSVGGTSLIINPDGSYNSEDTWNVAGQGASGGGISQYWTEPSAWRTAPGVNNANSTGVTCSAPSGQICREEPDVSLHADPTNGYLIYCSVSICSPAGFYSIGGTSAAAPMWAAMTTLTDEKSIKSGGFNMGFANPLLYSIASGSH